MGGKRPDPKDDQEWKSWVSYMLGRHEAMLKVLLALMSASLSLLLFILKVVMG